MNDLMRHQKALSSVHSGGQYNTREINTRCQYGKICNHQYSTVAILAQGTISSLGILPAFLPRFVPVYCESSQTMDTTFFANNLASNIAVYFRTKSLVPNL